MGTTQWVGVDFTAAQTAELSTLIKVEGKATLRISAAMVKIMEDREVKVVRILVV